MTVDTETAYGALRSVAARYAAGVDRRDRALFLSAFTENAVMVAPTDNGTQLELCGHDEIGSVVELITRYPRTFHFVGQSRYEFGPIESTGEVYCIAHHLTPEQDRDLVMYVRYHDTYRHDSAEAWLITRREVHIDWTETRPLRFKEDQP